MAKRALRLSKLSDWLEPGPVVLLAMARRGRANVMRLSWRTMMEFASLLHGFVVRARAL
ncbi:MAG TPA: hypothetical protein VED83_02480 [Burkholderiaceae bacterium]|nr:hypothetical protein [Burkholderiaceae bacterium]